MSIHINHPTPRNRQTLIDDGYDTYTTEEATNAFEFRAFAAPLVEVVRRSDGKRGTLRFCGGGADPRIYYNFEPFGD